MSTSTLSTLLASALPASLRFKVHHLATPATPSSPLFSPFPGNVAEPTTCENHLLFISLPREDFIESNLIAFAIEVYIYVTEKDTTIFVSKADSTGWLSFANVPPEAPSIVRSVTSTFLHHLIDSQPNDRRIVLSLFARSQDQYLFPGSVEVPGKHVLDDRQLIKWWCRTVDPVLRAYHATEAGSGGKAEHRTASAYVLVPGCDQYETRSFFPSTARSDPSTQSRWRASHPLYLLANVDDAKTAIPPRCLVPRFPDDPKSRFLDDLDDEIRLPDSEDFTNEGRWRSVTSLEQFWELMSYRQECSAGRLVGFIWVVVTPPATDDGADSSTEHVPATSKATTLPTPAQSQTPAQSFNGSLGMDRTPLQPLASNRVLDSPPPSSPVLAAESQRINQTIDIRAGPGHDILSVPVATVPKPTVASSPLTINPDAYDELVAHLLSLDFSSVPLSIDSTHSLFRLASQMASMPESSPWRGEEIVGNQTFGEQTVNGTNGSLGQISAPTVNILTAITKKKRKAAENTGPLGGGDGNYDLAPSIADAETAAPTMQLSREAEVMTLDAGLVRKKRKKST